MAPGDPVKPLAGGVKTFSCPSCGGTVCIRAVGISITAVCQSCGSLIDVANDSFRLIQEAAVKTRTPQIALGTRGTLLGTEWEVIGYSIRSDASGAYPWREYLLFNPYQGFRFLVEANGHWNFVKMLRQDIRCAGGMAEFNDREYRLYDRGEAKTNYVMGEFYWRVQVGEHVKSMDYIAPPHMLCMEENDQEMTWSHAMYVDPGQLSDAFKVSLPEPEGVAPNQPSPVAESYGTVKLTALVLFILMWVVQIVLATHALNQQVYSGTVHTLPTAKGQIALSVPIDIPLDMGNVEIATYSPVDNNWVELGMSLVNDSTQESFDTIRTIEYYHGYDSDGAWTEGAQSNHAFISSVPGGKYHLVVEPDAGVYTANQTMDFKINVIRDVAMWDNFWIALALLLAYPLILMIRNWNFEVRRWSNSDYAPAAYRRNNS